MTLRLPLLLLLALPGRALDTEREDYAVIGWNDACSAAVERYGYAAPGIAIQSEPIMTRLGTLAIPAGKHAAETAWTLEADGVNTYEKFAVAAARRQLRKAGYDRPGFSEVIRDSRTVESSGSAEVILSTAILQARPDFWPDTRQWRWARTHYNPLSTCALMVYAKIGERDRFKFLLTRIYNASARSDRGRAHTTNGRLLFNDGDLEGALAETEIGARMAPELSATRYHYAALLALNGRPDDSLRELLASIKRDPRSAAKAADDMDFDSLRVRQDFQELVLGRKREGPPRPPN